MTLNQEIAGQGLACCGRLLVSYRTITYPFTSRVPLPVPVGYKSLYPTKPFTSISLTHLSLYGVAKFPRQLSFKDS